MATFYGQVKGNGKTAATRQGSRDSHITASVQSHKGSIITELYYGAGDELCIDIGHSPESSGRGRTVFTGTVEEFLKMCGGRC